MDALPWASFHGSPSMATVGELSLETFPGKLVFNLTSTLLGSSFESPVEDFSTDTTG